MKLTRRQIIQYSAAASMVATNPARVWSQNTIADGEVALDTLSDGNLVLPKSFIFGETPSEQMINILTKYGITGDTIEPSCNVTLLRSGDRNILFDVGAGPDFMPTTGKLIDAFDAIDFDPLDITDVVFTHAHPDHLWGLRDDFGDLIFPDATYHIGRDEWDYWTDENTVSTIGDARVTFAVGAKNRLDELANQIVLVDDGQEILPGVAAHLTPGHTPGHMAFEVKLGTESVMILGDCIANHHLAFEQPSFLSGSDQDAELAAKTRVSLLDRLSKEKMRLIGFHLPNGGIGRAERSEDGFIFVPDNA